MDAKKCCDVMAPHHHLIRDGKDWGPVCEPKVGFEHPPWCKETIERMHKALGA